MTRTASATPTMSSTWAPAPASTAAKWSAPARSTTCSPAKPASPPIISPAAAPSRSPPPAARASGKKVTVHGATANNLADVTAAFPLGTFTCVTGVSGSGKSSLTIDTLYAAAARTLNGARILAGRARQGHRPRASRQGHRHRPVADRPHPALQPRDLHRRLHPDPRLVRRPARKPGARLQARPLLLQRQGRPLRGVQGRRPPQDRDALPPRRLRHLRRLPRPRATTARRSR